MPKSVLEYLHMHCLKILKTCKPENLKTEKPENLNTRRGSYKQFSVRILKCTRCGERNCGKGSGRHATL